MNVARDHIERHRPAYVVVTVAYRSRPLLKAMLERIAPPTPIIVVDNSADHEDITDLVHARPMTTYIDAGGNIGFGAACNLAASVASQPFMAFVNPDADVDVAVLDRLVDEIASDPRCSSAGPLLVEADGRPSAGSGGWLPTPLRAVVHATGLFRVLPESGIWLGRHTNAVLDVEWIAGTCLVIVTDVFRQLGGFASAVFPLSGGHGSRAAPARARVSPDCCRGSSCSPHSWHLLRCPGCSPTRLVEGLGSRRLSGCDT